MNMLMARYKKKKQWIEKIIGKENMAALSDSSCKLSVSQSSAAVSDLPQIIFFSNMAIALKTTKG